MIGDTARQYRARFYSAYAELKQRSSLQQVRDENAAREPYIRKLVSRFLPRDRAARILDLGCGAGALLSLLASEGYHDLAGVDTSPDQVDLAHQMGLQWVVRADLLDFLATTPNQSFDVVIAFDVLEHFSKDEVLQILFEVRRVLRASGILILHVPNAAAIFSGRVYWSDFTHETAFTADSLRQVMAATGFSRLQCFEDRPVVHGGRSAVRAIVWYLFRSVFRLIYVAETGDAGGDIILSQNLLAIAHNDRSHS